MRHSTGALRLVSDTDSLLRLCHPFIIFDVEAVFLFPWAVVFLKATPAVFYEMLIFIGILFFGVVYGWRKGVLQWR